MTSAEWLLIILLAASTFSVRVIGLFAGQKITEYPHLKKALDALPGCLLVALIATSLSAASSFIWFASAIAVIVAILSNHVILTMILGFTSLFMLQTYF
ncbi:MAG: AzlD domain-containing protein [Sneathiellales bacterium]|nr:AzlD domain-containing protein [Sneathiellales bacterium]